MAAPALRAITNITLGADSASVVFNNIPQEYGDIRIVHFVTSSSGNQDIGFKVNGTTGTTATYLAGFGSSTGSGTNADVLGYVNSSGLLNQIDILDYSATNKNKAGLIRYGAVGNFTAMSGFRWASNDPITSVQFYLGTGTFSAGSTFTLYGVLA